MFHSCIFFSVLKYSLIQKGIAAILPLWSKEQNLYREAMILLKKKTQTIMEIKEKEVCMQVIIGHRWTTDCFIN